MGRMTVSSHGYAPILAVLVACGGGSGAHETGDGGDAGHSDASKDSGHADASVTPPDGGVQEAAHDSGSPESGSSSWSGILAPSRAIDWSQAGVIGGIPSSTWTQCGTTIAPYGTSAAPASPTIINAAISACPPNTYVQLGAGTFYLSSGILIEGHDDVEVRGMGASATFLVFSAADPCQGASATICFASSDINWAGGPSNGGVDWTASSYAPKATTISLASVPNLKVGNPIILDQTDATSDEGAVLVAQSTSGGNPYTAPGSPGPYSLQGANGARTGRGQVQIVTVTQCDGSSTAGHSCASGSNITISPGLYMPTWNAANTPQAWWATNPVKNVGIQDVSIDDTNVSWSVGSGSAITFFNALGGWARGVRTVDTSRNVVWAYYSAHLTMRDNYSWLSRNSTSTSYGFECYTSSDDLVENNIFEAIVGPLTINGSCEGLAMGYNFSILGFYTSSAGYVMPMSNLHGINADLNLYEGNIGSLVSGDDFHGTHNLDTMFRNYLMGNYPSCTNSPAGTPYASATFAPCMYDQVPVQLMAFSRFFNVVGNVLGEPGVQTSYQSGDAPIYSLGNGDSSGTVTVPTDPVTPQTLMRWGNYDTVNAAAQWSSSEVPSSLTGSQAPYSNAVPTNHALPASFYHSSKPSWWPSAKPWPLIGPDVTGGNLPGLAGHANTNPAEDCFLNVMKAQSDGTGGPYTFDASTCYGPP
jgi:hypothetical protein